jgi:hypothetical protein
MENSTLLCGLSYFSTVQYSDFIFQILYRGKIENRKLLSGRSYFSASEFFSPGKLGIAVFPPASFFSAGEFFQPTVFGFYYFSVVRKMAENPVGFLPYPFLNNPSLIGHLITFVNNFQLNLVLKFLYFVNQSSVINLIC